MYILGINTGHDATAVLLKDENVIASIAEERMTRIKYHFGFPYQSIKECIRIADIEPKEIKTVVLGGNTSLSSKASFSHYIMVNSSGKYDVSNTLPFSFLYKKILFKIRQTLLPAVSCNKLFTEALKKIGINAEIVSYDHHLCHAASAYFNFGFSESLIITADGSGDGLSSIVAVARDGEFNLLHKVDEDDSLGSFYSAVTNYLGFKRNRHEGKITGLAAYGKSDALLNKFKQIINSTDDKSSYCSLLIKKIPSWKKYLQKRIMFFSGKPGFVNEAYLNYLATNCNENRKEDIAAACQQLSEEICADYVEYWVNKTKIGKVALAGGIFSNVRINQKILELPGVEEIFIHPNMGDGGIAMGAALLFYNSTLKQNNSFLKPHRIGHVYYGSEYHDEEISAVIEKNNFIFYCPEDFAGEVARLVYEGKIVGIFNNKMEYGPRALGARTILANATNHNINDWLNKRLKRTEFMPFAPVCLEENAHLVFDNYEKGKYPACFMTITFNVKEEWKSKIPAVVHVDGTARPQTITRGINPLYYDIVSEYTRISGLPALINTSFNAHEEPIVRTPGEALNSLDKNCIDVLAIGKYIVSKKKNA